ncbi:MAG: phage late control D family protein [Janthinobacterium lividum]
MRRAVYQISIDGNDVSSAFDPVLLSLTVKMGDGGEADSCDIELDDTDGQIELPRVGAQVTVALGWDDDDLPDDEQGAVVMFEGTTDEPKSSGGRAPDAHAAHSGHHAAAHGAGHHGGKSGGAGEGGSTPSLHSSGSRSKGRTLTISAKSADMTGKLKEKTSRHQDKAKFGDVAQQWGQKAGVTVKVDSSLAAIERPYWSMANESFLHWGTRIARDLGATFKVFGKTAVFVPRGGGTSASGQALQSISATWGDNLIEWSITPILSRPDFGKLSVRYYDKQDATWKEEEVGNDASNSTVKHRERFKAPTQDHAKNRAGANAAECKGDKGGGDSVTIDGEPAAQAEAPCNVSGVRPGADGTYTIKDVSHSLTRPGGFKTHLGLKQPSGSAGTDSRAAA